MIMLYELRIIFEFGYHRSFLLLLPLLCSVSKKVLPSHHFVEDEHFPECLWYKNLR